MQNEKENSEVLGAPPPPSQTTVDNFRLLMKEILITAENSSDFQRHVIQECYATEAAGGDYEVKISRLLELNQTYDFFGSRAATIHQLTSDIIADENNHEEPIIFVPFIEDRDADSVLQNCTSRVPEAVLAADYNPATQECPAYTLSGDDLYHTSARINEEYAWANPVWVFNQFENVGPGEIYNHDPVSPTAGHRLDGRREYCGNIQVTDLGAIESWASGQVELRVIIYQQNGQKIKDKKFKKVKRKHFRDLQWYDYNEFVVYWNINNVGNYMLEQWYEVDGGGSVNFSQSYPAPTPGFPSISVSYSIGDYDDDMGQIMVQFTDPLSTEYPITNANFKRRNIP